MCLRVSIRQLIESAHVLTVALFTLIVLLVTLKDVLCANRAFFGWKMLRISTNKVK